MDTPTLTDHQRDQHQGRIKIALACMDSHLAEAVGSAAALDDQEMFELLSALQENVVMMLVKANEKYPLRGIGGVPAA